MVDHAISINVCERFERHAMTLVLLIDPGGKRLLHHPSARALKTYRHRLDLFGEGKRDVRRHDFGFGRHFITRNQSDYILIEYGLACNHLAAVRIAKLLQRGFGLHHVLRRVDAGRRQDGRLNLHCKDAEAVLEESKLFEAFEFFIP